MGCTYLVDFCRACFKSLEGFLARFLGFVVDEEFLGFPPLLGDGCLAVDEVKGEAFRVFDGEDVAATRGVFHLLDTVV
jgi:hypothetical protein